MSLLLFFYSCHSALGASRRSDERPHRPLGVGGTRTVQAASCTTWQSREDGGGRGGRLKGCAKR